MKNDYIQFVDGKNHRMRYPKGLTPYYKIPKKESEPDKEEHLSYKEEERRLILENRD